MNATLECAGRGERLAINGNGGVGAHGLQVEPVISGVRRGERAGPRQRRVGRQRVSILFCEVEFSVCLFRGSALPQKSRLAIMAERGGWNGAAGHVVVNGELNLCVPRNLFHCRQRSYLPPGQSHRAFAVDADRIHLPRRWSDKNYGVEFIGFQGQGVVFVLQKHGGVFAGLFDDLRIRLNRLRSDAVLLLAVHVAEVHDLVENAARSAGDSCFAYGAILQSLLHSFRAELFAEVARH